MKRRAKHRAKAKRARQADARELRRFIRGANATRRMKQGVWGADATPRRPRRRLIPLTASAVLVAVIAIAIAPLVSLIIRAIGALIAWARI